jgi:hypothetical protein
VQIEGSFITRPSERGLEVWAPGWRLGIRTAPLIPAVLAVGWLLAGLPLVVEMLGLAALLTCSYVTHRLTRIGLLLDQVGLTVVDVFADRRIGWDDMSGLMGDRNGHDGRILVVRTDGSELRVPGTMSGEEMSPFPEEGDLSAVDQLGRLIDDYRRSVPAPS